MSLMNKKGISVQVAVSVLMIGFLIFAGFELLTGLLGTEDTAQAGTVFEEVTTHTIDELEDGDSDTLPWFSLPKNYYLFAFDKGKPGIDFGDSDEDFDVSRPQGLAHCGKTKACVCICEKECNPNEELVECKQYNHIDEFRMSVGDGESNNEGNEIGRRYSVAIKGDGNSHSLEFSLIGKSLLIEPSN